MRAAYRSRNSSHSRQCIWNARAFLLVLCSVLLLLLLFASRDVVVCSLRIFVVGGGGGVIIVTSIIFVCFLQRYRMVFPPMRRRRRYIFVHFSVRPVCSFKYRLCRPLHVPNYEQSEQKLDNVPSKFCFPFVLLVQERSSTPRRWCSRRCDTHDKYTLELCFLSGVLMRRARVFRFRKRGG